MSIGDGNPLTSILGDNPEMWAHINKTEVEKQLWAQGAQNTQWQLSNAGMQQAQHQPSMPVLPPQLPPNTTLAQRAREMFLKRMGGIRAELKIAPDDFLQCHIYGEQVYLFYCFSGRDGCVKEGIDLFPSDQLITQFRMVLST